MRTFVFCPYLHQFSYLSTAQVWKLMWRVRQIRKTWLSMGYPSYTQSWLTIFIWFVLFWRPLLKQNQFIEPNLTDEASTEWKCTYFCSWQSIDLSHNDEINQDNEITDLCHLFNSGKTRKIFNGYSLMRHSLSKEQHSSI
jgi:hypothetical protein